MAATTGGRKIYINGSSNAETAYADTQVLGPEHGSPDTTKIYDRRAQEVTVTEVERIRF